MIKLGSIVTDTPTGLTGMATLLQIEMDGSRALHLQPRGLNPETGKPVDGFWVVESRLKGGDIVDEPDLPLDLLGTEVEDLASGYKGTAISIMLHLSGCVHVNVQAKGSLSKTGEAIHTANFDIRRLKGKAIKTMSEKEKEQDKKDKPSPMDVAPRTRG